MRRLRAALHHPWTNLAVAVILIATSLAEVWESIAGAPVEMAVGGSEMRVGAFDGLLAYGLVHLLRAIAELVEDVERRDEAIRHRPTSSPPRTAPPPSR